MCTRVQAEGSHRCPLPGLVMGLGGPGSERAELGCRAKPGQPAEVRLSFPLTHHSFLPHPAEQKTGQERQGRAGVQRPWNLSVTWPRLPPPPLRRALSCLTDSSLPLATYTSCPKTLFQPSSVGKPLLHGAANA